MNATVRVPDPPLPDGGTKISHPPGCFASAWPQPLSATALVSDPDVANIRPGGQVPAGALPEPTGLLLLLGVIVEA